MPDNNSEIENISGRIKEKLLALLPKEGLKETGINGLKIGRKEEINKIESCFRESYIVLLLQGQKHAILGSEKITYGENQYLVTGVDLPSTSYITGVSHEKPLLAMSLPIDKYIISQLVAETAPVNPDEISFKSMAVADADSTLLDAFLRLAELVDKPEQKDVLGPMIIREIHYRLLIGPLGNQLRAVNTFGTHSNRVAIAVDWLKSNYKEQLKVDELAEKVNMASSTFRRNFKLVTTISPIQYQKRLRLQEARRLMLMDDLTASDACYTVGYESPTQFNREYKRTFGEPPRKDVRKILAI